MRHRHFHSFALNKLYATAVALQLNKPYAFFKPAGGTVIHERTIVIQWFDCLEFERIFLELVFGQERVRIDGNPRCKNVLFMWRNEWRYHIMYEITYRSNECLLCKECGSVDNFCNRVTRIPNKKVTDCITTDPGPARCRWGKVLSMPLHKVVKTRKEC